MATLFAAIPLAAVPLAAATPPFTCPAGPDTILFHGTILTGAHLQPADPSPTPAHVTALAICHGRISAVGSDPEVLATKSPQTTLVDLHGHFAMPGFNDAHVHLFSAGQRQVLSVNLTGTHSLADMQHRIQIFAASARPGAWILGGGWDQTLWTNKTLPTRQQIDAVTAGHPASFYRIDEHILVANSAALAAAGITSATPDPTGGKFDHDPSGALTGIVREIPATGLLERHIPPPTTAERRLALLAAVHSALAHGVTSVQDYSPPFTNFLVLEDLEREAKLPLRIAEWLDFTLPLDTLRQQRASHPADDPLLHLTQLKGFMDGSLGSRTAALAAPYADDPGNRGLPRFSQPDLDRLTSTRAAAGFQIGFHAIGDGANTLALNAFSAANDVAETNRQAGIAICLQQHPEARNIADSCGRLPQLPPSARQRFRIEHAQVLLPADFDRFAQLGIIASMQPSHLLTDMAWAGARLGNDRAQYAYAWRSFLDHHVTLAFGTDFPVESIDPFRGLYAAVTRQNEAGTQTFHPEQSITLAQAIYAYTQAPAFAEFRETLKGRLEPGFLADLIVLDRNLETIPSHDLLTTHVLQTIVDGQVVYTPTPAATTAPRAPAAADTPPDLLSPEDH